MKEPNQHLSKGATAMHSVNLFERSFGFIHSCFLAFAAVAVVSVGSRSTPFFDTYGSVHRLRLKQHGLRIPDLSFENATSIRRLRVSWRAVALIQRIQSQRAIVVISIHRLCACGSAARALFKSSGTWGSVHSLAGSISSITVSPASAPADARMVSSTLSQWLPLPSGSRGT